LKLFLTIDFQIAISVFQRGSRSLVDDQGEANIYILVMQRHWWCRVGQKTAPFIIAI